MIKTLLLQHLGLALEQAAPDLNALAFDPALLASFKLERPRNPDHGDYAVNVSFLARHTKMPPPAIAEVLAKHIPAVQAALPLSSGRVAVAERPTPYELTVVGGYLNFKLSDALLQDVLLQLLQTEAPGRNESLASEKILLEYVSANPTGPLHVGHGRWAALGDSLVRIFRHCGAFVTPEFYINDFGFQMEKLALSVWWRSIELLKNEGALTPAIPVAQDILQGRELPYPGEFVIELAAGYLQDAAQRQAMLADWTLYAPHYLSVQEASTSHSPMSPDITTLPEWGASIKARIIEVMAPLILKMQQALLDTMRVTFDVWTSEKQTLHDSGAVEKALETLKAMGQTYEDEGALWFRSSQFGDEKDRVLKKSDGSYTYLAADIAYHHEKFLRHTPNGSTYNRILNIWGADHHGYIARMRGAIEALGHNPNHFEVLLGQLVNLLVDGERTRMGKRRKMLTLQDVVDEVGVDATRFWMVAKSADTTLDFDVDLAASASSENPVFYVQYAHARCCSIFRNATESAPNIDTGEMAPPLISPDALAAYEQSLTPEQLAPLFQSLTESKDQGVLRTLLLQLDGFELLVQDAARLRSPHFITQHMLDVAAHFHSFYNVCRILTPDPTLTQARLMLIRAIQKNLAQALALIGVSAPEKM